MATPTHATEAPAEPAAVLEADVLDQVVPRRFTVDEFHRMVEAGVFGDEMKLALHARHGIPEYWIVNVKNSTVEAHRDPDPEAGRYRSLQTTGVDATLSPTGLPGVSISVRVLFA